MKIPWKKIITGSGTSQANAVVNFVEGEIDWNCFMKDLYPEHRDLLQQKLEWVRSRIHKFPQANNAVEYITDLAAKALSKEGYHVRKIKPLVKRYEVI